MTVAVVDPVQTDCLALRELSVCAGRRSWEEEHRNFKGEHLNKAQEIRTSSKIRSKSKPSSRKPT